MRTVGWIIVIAGFAWISCVDKLNQIVARVGWRDKMSEEYPPDRTYQLNDINDVRRRNSLHIEAHQSSALWGGILMLVGVLVLEVTHAKKRK